MAMRMFHRNVPGREEATLEGYLLDCELTLGQEEDRPAVLVCPGGGYLYCSAREGEPVALRYAAAGFHAFVLRYSVGRDAAGFSPLEEVSWAIGYIRQNAAAWHIAPDKIAVCGFSAGGHLALSAGVLAENKPNAMILCYPAASAPNIPKADFMLKLLEGKRDVTDADAQKYDLVSKIQKNAPPVFLTATAQDLLTAYGALPVAKAYSDLGLPYELHVFQFGPHGYALADATTADGCARKLDSAYETWHGLSVQWLLRVFGPPTFTETDRHTGRMAALIRQMDL